MRFPITTAALALICVLYGAPAVACVCLEPEPARALASAELVFSGVVVSVDTIPVIYPEVRTYRMRWKFKIGQVWKGPRAETVVVEGGGGSCDFRFAAGKHYVVFANVSSHGVHVVQCSRTKLVTEAIVERDFLGVPTVVSDSLRLPPLTAEEFAQVAKLKSAPAARPDTARVPRAPKKNSDRGAGPKFDGK